MTRQEEIWEEVGEIYVNNCRVGMDANEFSEELFNYLHSQRCRIEIDRKLPRSNYTPFPVEGGWFDGFTHAQKLMLKSGYVAVEPLIKGD